MDISVSTLRKIDSLMNQTSHDLFPSNLKILRERVVTIGPSHIESTEGDASGLKGDVCHEKS